MQPAAAITHSEHRLFPAVCPHCHEVSGLPVSASTVVGRPSAVLLKLKCDQCQHRWNQELERAEDCCPAT